MRNVCFVWTEAVLEWNGLHEGAEEVSYEVS